MDKPWLVNRLLDEVSAGARLPDALNAAIADLTRDVQREVMEGATIQRALEDAGLPSDIATRVRLALPHGLRPDALLRHLRVVFNPGGVAGIPTAECLARHLPPDREPTQEEMEEAWQQCLRK